MAYVSLYRKYRPQTFDEVVGQDHVTRTLRNAIEEDRLSHAYLFTGPRGTGKTSTARILAKAINCETGPTATPCGTCGQCVAIAEGTSVDVIELDMASHGGVDDARELRERALFAPASARRKVYILDEVHMASTAAFNALLKLIEEPPAHVLFAMATTDPQKVLPTIMSRVQRLDLRRVGATEVAAHVRELCVAEGYAIDDGAVEAVVRAGDGSVRDTLSVLEQVLAFAGRDVTAAAVAQTLGNTPMERVIDTVDLVARRDLAGLLALVQGLVDEGHDLRRFTLDLVGHLRDLLVLAVAPDRPDLVDATEERRARLQDQAGALRRETSLRAVAILAETVTEQRLGSPRLPLELALARLVVPGADGDVAELADRLARLESSGAPAAGAGQRPGYRAAPSDRPSEGAAVHDDAGTAAPRSDGEAPAPTQEPAERTSDEPAPAAQAPDEPGPDEPPATPAPAPAPELADPPSPPADPQPVTDPHPESGPATPEPPEPPEPADADADAPVPQEPPTSHAQPAAADAGDAAADEDPLAVVVRHWPGVLERLKQSSRRHHAMIEPAIPVAASRGILTIRYGRRHASFHAVQARTGELDRALREALEQACGLRFRIDVSVEGEDDRRRPMPPSVTPDDARTPVLDDRPADEAAPARPDAPSTSQAPPAPAGEPDDPAPTDGPDDPDEGTEVREAEEGAVAPTHDVDELLAAELDARLVEEHPPPDEPR